MSNESENKRIDLTQFEGITKGPWHLARYFSQGSWKIYWFDKEMSDNWDSIRAIGEEYRHEDFCFDVGVVASSEADAQLMASGPDLLAELMRCYEEIDALRGELDMAHICLSAHNFRQCDTCGDHYHDDYGPLCGHTASE
jgi:hypothetical protein